MKKLILIGLLFTILACTKTVKEPVYKYIYIKSELPDLTLVERPDLKEVMVRKYIVDNQTKWCMDNMDLQNLIDNKRGYENTIEEYERIIKLYLRYKNENQ